MLGEYKPGCLVLPKRCWYSSNVSTELGEKIVLTLPVLPHYAILLVEEDFRRQLSAGGHSDILIMEDKTTKDLNLSALIYETRQDNEFVVGCEERDLWELLELYNKYCPPTDR